MTIDSSLSPRSGKALVLMLLAGLAANVSAQTIYPEVHPNNTKAQATPVTLGNGDGVTGVSTAATGTADPASPDYFRIKTVAAPPAIYRHRMTLTNTTPGNSAWIRGRSQTATAAGTWPCSLGTATATENVGQTHLPDGNTQVSIWYGFGKGEEVYYRVSGVASTTGAYTAILETQPVAPRYLGTFSPGQITIDTSGRGHANDTYLAIWNSSFTQVAGYSNDGASINGGAPANLNTTSFLRRNFDPGIYYMAITIGTLAAELGAPCDDNVRNGPLTDFPNAAFNVSTADLTDVSFSINDGASFLYTASRGGRNQVAWFTFTVGDTGPSTFGRCCLDDSSCQVVRDADCMALDGIFGGAGTDCATPCPGPGVCCFYGQYCEVILPRYCEGNGNFLGESATCADCPCPNWERGIGGGVRSEFPGATEVTSIATFDDGTGRALYVAGVFQIAGNTDTNGIARWNGQVWSPLGQGLFLPEQGAQAFAMLEHSGSLYVGGHFQFAGAVPGADGVARWDGNSWHPLDAGVSGAVPYVFALALYDDGQGAALYAGGAFDSASGVPDSRRLAKWDGQSWIAIPGVELITQVRALKVFDSKLYVGGLFPSVGGVAGTRNIASWDGQSWAALGEGFSDRVLSLGVFDDGSGNALYAGGNFLTAGTTTVNHIAKWDGQSWSALGSGLQREAPSLSFVAYYLQPFDDGSGNALYVGGQFANASNVTGTRNVARWNGQAWESVYGLNTTRLFSFGTWDDGDGPAIYAGGTLVVPPGSVRDTLQRWRGCATSTPCYANCDDSTVAPILNIDDFTCFINRFALNDTYANCDGSTIEPVLNIDDFTCFINAFALGCD